MQVCILRPGNKGYNIFPGKATVGSAGFDLVADIEKTIYIEPGHRTIIPTGVAVAVPEGFVGLVCARSGFASRTGVALTNGVGVIDDDYRGEVSCAMINLGDKLVEIVPGMRIAQLVIVSLCQINPEFVDNLPETTRGEGGFGSTGR